MEHKTKKIFSGLDIAKFLCAFFIIFYHYFSEIGSLPFPLNESLSLYAVAVALFASISGFLMFDKLKNIKDYQLRKKCVYMQAFRIYKIYLIWSIPYLLYTILKWDITNISFEFLFWKIQGWIFNSTFYTIWFMPMLALGLIATFFISEKLEKRYVILIALLMYCIGSLNITYSFLGNKIYYYEYINNFINTWLGGPRGWLFYIFPFALIGKIVSEKRSKGNILSFMILSIISLGLVVVEGLILRSISGGSTGIDMTIMMIPTIYFILHLFLSISINIRKNISIWFRNMSVLIFMSQRIFLTVLPEICDVFLFEKYGNYLGGILTIGVTFLFCELIILLSKRIKILKNLY